MNQRSAGIELVDAEEVIETEHHAPQDDRSRRMVTIDNKDSGDTVRLRVDTSETVAAVLEAMYAEFRLSREPDDRLTCRHSGTDVYQFEALTVAEYVRAGKCPDLHWSFASDTGGASP